MRDASGSASSRAVESSDRARVPSWICVRSASLASLLARFSSSVTLTRLGLAAMHTNLHDSCSYQFTSTGLSHTPLVEAGRRGAGIVRAGIRVGAAALEGAFSTTLGPEIGGASAQALAEVGETLVGYVESRAQQRVARTLRATSDEIASRRANGQEVRPEIGDLRSDGARSLFESVVEAAAESSEEKKCRLISNFYADVAIDEQVSVDDALLYLRRIRAASWRQLVALRYFEDPDRKRERELIGAAGAEGDAVIHAALGIELSELAGRGLEFIGFGQEGGAVADPASTFGGGTITSNSVARIRATGLGETVSRLGRLADIVSTDELDAISVDLRGRPS